MQFGKVYINPESGISKKDFMETVKGKIDIDKDVAWERFSKEASKHKPKEEKPSKGSGENVEVK